MLSLVLRARSTDSVLLIIDMQEKIINTVAEKENLLRCLQAIIEASNLLNIPSVVTQQEKLGDITPKIKKSYGGDVPILKKMVFSCCGLSEFRDKLQRLGRKTIVVCGVETHICVMQTVLDLLALKYEVLLLRDVTSSYRIADRETAIERMRDAGAWVSTTESAIYELMEDAQRPEFKQMLQIIKSLRNDNSSNS
ncbi:MAG: isochorismatase family protein [Candidatus Bathyarchaeia archaeon]